jgi:anti-anti-sigma factor
VFAEAEGGGVMSPSLGGGQEGTLVIKLRTCPDSSVVCQLSGALDFEAATELRHQIAAIVRPDLELIFDLRRVDYIDAFGASVLVGSVRRVRAMGGRSRVCRVNPRIRWVLELIGIDRFLTEPQDSDDRNAA